MENYIINLPLFVVLASLTMGHVGHLDTWNTWNIFQFVSDSHLSHRGKQML